MLTYLLTNKQGHQLGTAIPASAVIFPSAPCAAPLKRLAAIGWTDPDLPGFAPVPSAIISPLKNTTPRTYDPGRCPATCHTPPRRYDNPLSPCKAPPSPIPRSKGTDHEPAPKNSETDPPCGAPGETANSNALTPGQSERPASSGSPAPPTSASCRGRSCARSHSLASSGC